MDIANSIVTLLVAVLVVLLLGVFLGATGMYYWLDSRSKMTSSASECAFVSQKKKGKISYNESEVLGRGLSKVYKGMFEDRIPVAVKIIEILDKEQTSEFSNSLNSIDQSLWPRQQREININQSQTEMGHPNLVRYFGYEVIENGKTIMLLALELCQCTLEDFIYKRKDFPALSNRDIFQQMANGLNHLHSRNIAHRDLKPSNVMIKTDFKSTHQVKIADFGLSKFLPDDTSESALSSTCGTKGWMAPELWQRHFTEGKGDELFRFRRCDVYSLGLIFFYIASDGIKPPEEGMGNTTFDNKLINDDFTLIDLLNKMTSKTPTDRYQTDGVLKHPALWTAENTLIFFSKVSDFLMDKSVDASKLEDPSVINISWKTRVPLNVRDYLFPQSIPTKGRPNYDDKKVKSLLRAVRNITHHFNELPKDIKGELGDTYEQRLQFWTSRFNRLIIHTYDAMKPYIKQNPEFGQFF